MIQNRINFGLVGWIAIAGARSSEGKISNAPPIASLFALDRLLLASPIAMIVRDIKKHLALAIVPQLYKRRVCGYEPKAVRRMRKRANLLEHRHVAAARRRGDVN